MKKILLSILLSGLVFCSCGKLDFVGFLSGYDTDVNDRFSYSMKYLETHPVADINATSDDYKVYLVTDIHCDGKNDRLEKFVSACLADGESEKFVLCLGDIVNGRKYQESVYKKLQPLSDAGWKFFNALGNHDTYFREYDKFRQYWPLTVFSFKVNTPDAGSDLFLCLDSADGSFGTSQRKWVEDQLKEASGKYRNIYVFTHTNFFNTDNTQLTSGNFSLEESFDYMSMFDKYGVRHVLTGHDHYYEYCRFRSVDYYTFNALCNTVGSYYLLTFSSDLKFEEITVD